MALCSIPNIHKVIMKSRKVTRFDMNERFNIESEWMLDTKGCNFLAVMGHEYVEINKDD